MFNIRQGKHNPQHDINKAIKLHNTRGREIYRKKVMKNFYRWKNLSNCYKQLKSYYKIKKTIALLIICVICTVSYAQHLEFMGIPLDGTIDDFTKKLEAKGVHVSSVNQFIKDNAKLFKGNFYGKTADIFIYYYPDEKIVYRAEVILRYKDFETSKTGYNSIAQSIYNKYKYCCDVKSDGYGGKECSTFTIYSESKIKKGTVSLDFNYNKFEYDGQQYELYINYFARKSYYIGDNEEMVFDVVEQMPSFPGGPSALMSFLGSNVKYPVVAQENGVQGRVVISFVVEKDGSIFDVQVVRSVDPSLDKEALRVVKSMPNWIPGKQNGQAVRVKYNVPVAFKLQ